MFSGIAIFLMLSQFDDEPGGGIKSLIFLLIFVGLSALSGLLKRKQEKSGSEPKKPTKPAVQRPVPLSPRSTSAIRLPQHQSRLVPSALRAQSALPSPEIVTPIPTPARISPRPDQTGSRARHPAHTRKTAAAQIRPVAPKIKTSPQTPTQKQVKSALEAAALQKSMTTETKPKPAVPTPASDNIQLGLEQQDSLIRAVLYAEILDQPMALRRSGSHDFLDF